MVEVRVTLIVAGFCLLEAATAETEIHKCTDADGGIVFSQLPCVALETQAEEVEAEEQAETAEPFPAPPTPSVTENPPQDAPLTETSGDDAESEATRAACRKRYRDAIDEIDAEIRRDYSPDKAEEFKQRLLALTRKLRQC